VQVVEDQERTPARRDDLAQHQPDPFEREQAQLCGREIGGRARRGLPLGQDKPQPLIERRAGGYDGWPRDHDRRASVTTLNGAGAETGARPVATPRPDRRAAVTASASRRLFPTPPSPMTSVQLG
jgi:hypothetical protein